MNREYKLRVINGQAKKVRAGKLPKILVEPNKCCGWCGHKGMWMDNKFNWHCSKCQRESKK